MCARRNCWGSFISRGLSGGKGGGALSGGGGFQEATELVKAPQMQPVTLRDHHMGTIQHQFSTNCRPLVIHNALGSAHSTEIVLLLHRSCKYRHFCQSRTAGTTISTLPWLCYRRTVCWCVLVRGGGSNIQDVPVSLCGHRLANLLSSWSPFSTADIAAAGWPHLTPRTGTLYRLQNVFVQIAKYICPNCKIYLSNFQKCLFNNEYCSGTWPHLTPWTGAL